MPDRRDEDIRALPCFLNPQAEHLLDWFHITMRITVMSNMAKSLRPPPDDDLPDDMPRPEPASDVSTELERCKWFLWHGNLYQTLQSITIDAKIANEGSKPTKAIGEFDSYVRTNSGRIPNCGECRRADEALSTAFVGSTMNEVVSKRMAKKQQMPSAEASHSGLNTRSRCRHRAVTIIATLITAKTTSMTQARRGESSRAAGTSHLAQSDQPAVSGGE